MDWTWINQVIDYVRNLLDIAIVWMVVHYLLRVFRNNARTMQIMKGIIYLFIANFVADYLQLRTFKLLLNYLLDWGFLAVIVIFQPEIRSLLEKMGQVNPATGVFSLTINQKQRLVQEITSAVNTLSVNNTGALITIQRGTSLEDYVKASTPLNAEVTKELLISLFATTTPLHDGAIIVQGNKIASASAFFPPTNNDLPTRFGARHRAAVGISEISDSITVIVSEETGSVSVAQNGKLTLFEDEGHLYNFLSDVLKVDEDDTQTTVPFWKRREQSTSDYSAQSMSDVIRQETPQESEDE
ncbi:MAG TPA: TIGR00159 family protein [Erysipelothrix sp.]|jgi:uncharacterized protein (TIGR00159 family)|nr:TIGR00159 family protein [Erysipelothrix sp.]